MSVLFCLLMLSRKPSLKLRNGLSGEVKTKLELPERCAQQGGSAWAQWARGQLHRLQRLLAGIVHCE